MHNVESRDHNDHRELPVSTFTTRLTSTLDPRAHPIGSARGIPLDRVGSVHTVLTEARGLTAADLTAIAELERRVLDHDGGRLKLEWGYLRSRTDDQVNALLWHHDGLLVGFVGLYSFGGSDLELAGMVDPAVRRSGIGTALLDAALAIGRDRGHPHALLVTPRDTDAGRAFAVAHHRILEHSEHFLVLGATPTADPIDSRVTLRTATDADTDDVVRILTAGFGWTPTGLTITNSDDERTLVVEREATIVGTLRLARDGDTGSVYGFAVDPAVQGQGIGRDTLTRVCRSLRDDGAERVTLEVASDNDRALDLYLSVGFERRATEDYYALPLP
jgi:ribosomal protein S18 acetylase RimI-like enzyme